MEFIDSNIDKYVVEHTSLENDLLKKIQRETHLNVLQPRMLSGPFQGRFLSLISSLVQPNKILEIGTYTGYSALCLAEGLSKSGTLITIDINDELEERVKGYFQESSFADQLTLKIGPALSIIPQLEHDFDLVFIDADKKNYINYYKEIFPKVKVGGMIIADNVLWSGKVVDPNAQDPDTQLLRDFNLMIQEDARVSNILLPIRDGLMLVRKISN
jgi:predicted O-methyltransferase YrrM